MNLPIVTFEPDSEFDEEAGYSMYGRGVVFDGKTPYALVRVADGQTVTAEKVWWCVVKGFGIESNAHLQVCPWCVGEAKPSGCGEVTLVRGADI